MRIFSADPSCYLIEMADLAQDQLPDHIRADLPSITQIVDWAQDYLCHSHDQLGRDGPVCPFVGYSLSSCLFFLTVQHGREITREDVYTTILKYRDWFLELEPRSGREAQYKTILVLFPDIPVEDATDIIDATQALLKPDFVSKGLMIGQFHQKPPDEAGLWNQAFRPLKSPIPLLAIRHMVPTDFPFLMKEKRFVEAFLAIYAGNIHRKQRHLVTAAVRQFGIDCPELAAE